MEPHPGQAGTLRERKKEIIRRAILKSAKKLFERHGYDNVTVAQIADQSDVSVKTLFTYFRSKEDLLFQDDSLITTIIAALRLRRPDQTPAQAVLGSVIKLIRENGSPAESLGQYQHAYGNSVALQGRLLRLWAEYEEIVSAELAALERLDSAHADHRFLAAQLITIVRATTWKEVYQMAVDAKNPETKIIKWLQKMAAKF